MARFNLDDYTPVEERIGMFYREHPDGRIITGIHTLDPPMVVFKAAVYRNGEENPWATGYAYEKEGEGHVNRTSYIENCETSAVGRALANAGYHGKREGSPRPSREEMQKVQRMDADYADEGVNPNTGEIGSPLDQKLGFGKHREWTWREVRREHPGYIEWALETLDDKKVPPDVRDALENEHVGQTAGDPNVDRDGVRLDEPDDDMPF